MCVEHILTPVAHNMVCICLREKCEVTLAVPRCQRGVIMRWDPAIAFHEYIVPAALNEPDSQTAKDHQMSLCQCQNHILSLSPYGISKIMAELNPFANLAARQVFWGYDILILLSFNLLRKLSPAAKWPRRGSLAHLGHPCLSSPQHREAPWSTKCCLEWMCSSNSHGLCIKSLCLLFFPHPFAVSTYRQLAQQLQLPAALSNSPKPQQPAGCGWRYFDQNCLPTHVEV